MLLGIEFDAHVEEGGSPMALEDEVHRPASMSHEQSDAEPLIPLSESGAFGGVELNPNGQASTVAPTSTSAALLRTSPSLSRPSPAGVG